MKDTKNSILTKYLQHIRDLIPMLGETSKWEFVIGDIDVIDDGKKKRLYFINEKTKKIEIAVSQQNSLYNEKYTPGNLESLFTGLSVLADLSGNNNKESRIMKLKRILIDELSQVNDDGTKFINEGLNSQYSAISNELNYIEFITKFNLINSIVESNDISGLEKILVDELKDKITSSYAASWSEIFNKKNNKHEIHYIAKILLSFFGKDAVINSIRNYFKKRFGGEARYGESDIVYVLKYVKNFSEFEKDNQDQFENLLDFCFDKYANSLISDSITNEDKYLRFNTELIRLFEFVEFKPNSMNEASENFLDELFVRLVASLKKVLIEKDKPICLSQDFYSELSNDWAHKFNGYYSTSTLDSLKENINKLKIYNNFLEKLLKVKDDFKFVYKSFSLVDIFTLKTFGRTGVDVLLRFNNEIRFYSESETAKNFLLEHQKSCNLFSQLISEESIDFQIYKMDIEFLLKKMELMAKSDCDKLKPEMELSSVTDEFNFNNLVEEDFNWGDNYWLVKDEQLFKKVIF